MTPEDPALRPWKTHATRRGESLRILRPRFDLVENPRNGQRFEALVLEAPEWANVVARDEAGRFLLVRQWRFGSSGFSLEVPGGVVHRNEEPLRAAQRELLEEIGGEAASWHSLGSVSPNPALFNNRCHQFLAEGVRIVAEPTLDEGEDLELVRLDATEVLAAIQGGEIHHALALTALARVLPVTGTGAAL